MANISIRSLAVVGAMALAGCQRDAPQPPPAKLPPAAAAPAVSPVVEQAPPASKDISERDPRFIVGISFPQGMQRYPGLAAELQHYADAARAELSQAVDALGDDKLPAPYDLSLAFTTITETPAIVTVAADGSTYTGGAHGNPLVARFVWLTGPQKLLRIDDVIADQAGWRDLSDSVREQLRAALSQRIDADEVDASDRAEMMKSALKMIDTGSEPVTANFREFEPVLDVNGKIIALRFVFPPYQVGPYSDGVQNVDVPASVLRPHLQAAVLPLFAPA